MFHRGECGLPSPRFGDHVSVSQHVKGRGSSFSPSRCSWGAPFLPTRLWGSGDGVFAAPRYPDVENPCAPHMKREGSLKPFLQILHLGCLFPSLSFLPNVLGKRVTFPLAQGLELSEAKPATSNTHAPRKLCGESETNRPLNPFGAWLWNLSNPRKPSSRTVNLHLGVFAFQLASPTPPQGAHSVHHLVDAFQVTSSNLPPTPKIIYRPHQWIGSGPWSGSIFLPTQSLFPSLPSTHSPTLTHPLPSNPHSLLLPDTTPTLPATEVVLFSGTLSWVCCL